MTGPGSSPLSGWFLRMRYAVITLATLPIASGSLSPAPPIRPRPSTISSAEPDLGHGRVGSLPGMRRVVATVVVREAAGRSRLSWTAAPELASAMSRIAGRSTARSRRFRLRGFDGGGAGAGAAPGCGGGKGTAGGGGKAAGPAGTDALPAADGRPAIEGDGRPP